MRQRLKPARAQKLLPPIRHEPRVGPHTARRLLGWLRRVHWHQPSPRRCYLHCCCCCQEVPTPLVKGGAADVLLPQLLARVVATVAKTPTHQQAADPPPLAVPRVLWPHVHWLSCSLRENPYPLCSLGPHHQRWCCRCCAASPCVHQKAALALPQHTSIAIAQQPTVSKPRAGPYVIYDPVASNRDRVEQSQSQVCTPTIHSRQSVSSFARLQESIVCTWSCGIAPWLRSTAATRSCRCRASLPQRQPG